ncbi:efflux RND transporter permease subunit [Rhodobium gokarnense]|uniref:Multidrug efflux pump subunit AcrB n=1 Tax=Rhodobium gokarnense TaxID=364296 RepID=A0ABT3H7R4_9HYPH|nr:efflux RND transporter permease subunit [Rhodobium gokarnense]MCW2306424.1 multidrug efflux pump subunit AcrB [Rhodobium gokarnense]
MNWPRDDRSGVVSLFARHPNAANLLMVLMLMAGVFALGRIPIQFFPTLEVKTITITVSWPGASAEDVEGNILGAIEPEVRFLDGVTDVESSAREGSGSIILEFDQHTDMQKALSDVESAIAQVTTLPEDSETPKVSFRRWMDRVARVSISGPFSEAAMKAFAKRMRDDLIERGIDQVTFNGMRDEEFRIEVPERELRRLGLTVSDVAGKLSGNTRDQPSGQLEGAVEKQLRAETGGETVEGLGGINVKTFPTGERVLLRDIARVEKSFDKDALRGFAFGEPAIEMTVSRSIATDTLTAARILNDYLEEVRPTLPNTLKVAVYDDRSTSLKGRIDLLFRNGVQGLFVVVAILFLFLNARIAFWVAAGIPVAMMATIGFMYVTGQTINMISLFALIMTLGIIVDDAIVVGEHTATRSSLGDDPLTAAELGAGHMITPVMGASLTTIAAFAPILLVRDTIGQIMGALPLVVIAVVIASIIECFFVLPGHLAHSLGRRGSNRWSFWRQFLIALVIAVVITVLPADLAAPGGPGTEDFSEAVAALTDGAGGIATVAGELVRLFFSAVSLALLWIAYGAVTLGVAIAHGMAALRASVPIWAVTLLVAVGAFGIAGLLEAFFLAMGRRQRRREGQGSRGFRRAFDAGFARFRDGPFNAMVTAAYHWRYMTIAVAASLLIIFGYGFVFGGRVGFVFFPSPEAEVIRGTIEFNAGISEDRAVAGIRDLEAALLKTEKQLTGGKEELIVASFVSLGKAGRARGDNVAEVDVQLTPSEDRSIRTPDIIKAWRRQVPDIVGVKRLAIFERRGGPPGRDIDIQLTDGPPETLKAAAHEAITLLSGFPGVSGVADDLPYGKPELVMTLTPRGAALGFTIEDIGRQIRNSFEGAIARRIGIGDEEVIIRVVKKMREAGDAQLRSLELRTPAGDFVPLMEAVNLTERQGFSVIQREDGRSSVSVTADVDADVTSNQEIIDKLNAGPLPDLAARYGINYRFSGRAEERMKAFEDLKIGILLALGVIYIILAWIFASYWRPLAVMLIIPFGLVGAVVGHYLMGFKLTVMSLISLLGLAGILVNDSIILVSRIDERARDGDDLEHAAIGASRDRLRAVLLTSLTTIGGLAPLMTEQNIQAQFLLPMAITIVFGLAVATLLVLFLVPALIGIGGDVRTGLRGLYGRRDGRGFLPAE